MAGRHAELLEYDKQWKIHHCPHCGWIPDWSTYGTERPRSERIAAIAEFLEYLHWIHPNLNDTFFYASADSEQIATSENEEMIARVWDAYGHAGIVALVAHIRHTEPIPPLRTPEYEAAKLMLAGWEYESD